MAREVFETKAASDGMGAREGGIERAERRGVVGDDEDDTAVGLVVVDVVNLAY